MSRFINLIGQRFGKLLVIERAANRKGIPNAFWLCKCDCGNIKEIASNALRCGYTISCGCYRKEKMINEKRIEPGLSAKRMVYSNYKLNAKKKNISFELTFEKFISLTQKNCHYCDSELLNLSIVKGRNGSFIYNGIDRKDNTKGYTIENCVPCCKICNVAKGSMSYDDFIKWGKKLGRNLIIMEEKETGTTL